MSRGYKRRQKLIRRGQWETPGERSARVFGEFVDNIEREVARLQKMPPEQLEAIRQHYQGLRYEQST